MGVCGVLEQRSSQLEFLDELDFCGEFAEKSYNFMESINYFFGGTRVVRTLIEEKFSKENHSRNLKILDIGAGTCDVPLAILKWSQKHKWKIEYTCLEQNEKALELARRKIQNAKCNSIKLLNINVFKYQPDEIYDFAVGSMFFHHLKDNEILLLIDYLRNYVKEGVLINDLQRSVINYFGGWLLTAMIAGQVRHDALLSIRRGFQAEELFVLLSRLKGVSVKVWTAWFCRTVALIKFEKGVIA